MILVMVGRFSKFLSCFKLCKLTYNYYPDNKANMVAQPVNGSSDDCSMAKFRRLLRVIFDLESEL